MITASIADSSAWRVDTKKFGERSFSGHGASLLGGRWNSAGVHVVYASQHLAMAALEKYVNLPRPIPRNLYFVRFGIRFAGLPVLQARVLDLPDDWRAEPAPASTRDFGDAWFKGSKTAILAVPSVLIPEEINFVLNPAHPDFSKIEISPAESFTFDPRSARLVDPHA